MSALRCSDCLPNCRSTRTSCRPSSLRPLPLLLPQQLPCGTALRSGHFTVSISLVMRSYSAFCSFWYACRLFCSAFCCSLAGFQLLSLILQVFLILYLLVLGSLQIIALLLNILLGGGVLRYDLLIIVHDCGNNLQTAEKIREVGRVQQNLQIAGLALLIRRADSLRKTLPSCCPAP